METEISGWLRIEISKRRGGYNRFRRTYQKEDFTPRREQPRTIYRTRDGIIHPVYDERGVLIARPSRKLEYRN